MKMVFPKFNTHNFKLQTKICPHPIWLQDFFFYQNVSKNQSMPNILEWNLHQWNQTSVGTIVGCSQACPATLKFRKACLIVPDKMKCTGQL